MEVQVNQVIFSALLVVGFTALTVKFLNWVWFGPKKLEKFLRNQGLHGNPYSFLVGDIKDLISATKQEQPKSIRISDPLPPHIFPYYHRIRSKYGENSILWFGPSPILIISGPELMKEILTRPDVFPKWSPDVIGQMVAGGLLFLEDEKWAKHRKIINPAFHMEKLKNMVTSVRLSCESMIEKWEALFSGSHNMSREIDVWPYLENLTCDVISRTAFGSSHEEGRRIFTLQREKAKLVLELLKFIFIPGWRFLPTKANKRMKAYSEEIESLLRCIVDQRDMAMRRGEKVSDDLLTALLRSNSNETHGNGNKTNAGMSIEDVIQECKLFYFAGSETTALLLVWTMVMLAKHREWQDRARDEVSRVLSNDEPSFDNLSRLKIVTMILNEVLRLYPPAPMLSRTAKRPAKLGDMNLPAGLDMILLIGVLHNDPKIWGEDANQFKPERFSGGISAATKGQFSFLPFSAGPKVCVGQQFAMMEAKLAMALILRGFSFELSPSYLHAPFPIITLRPQHGVPLVLRKL